nr:immunoglobulin heavy chain junction region [Macaca mulatta]MOW99936.1 immunoglobulin heavy chain junction region [Macaca mulatta]MOX02841.1 immunoglobulin heavy chain junction region [Macaca mulatta]MOX03576.1 immunoglobulin heavy chain junction region [Macaca mulatta]MOX05589.1 immunoglobulin heavy chain junction region [Macaca mulatta]
CTREVGEKFDYW